jgi:hypothetical protein
MHKYRENETIKLEKIFDIIQNKRKKKHFN